MSRLAPRRLAPAAVLLLLAAAPLAAQEFPKTPPKPAAVRPAPFPPFQEAVLPNGLRIIVVENRRENVVSVSLSFGAGAIRDPDGKEGLANMVSGLLTKGAGQRTADQMAEAIEATGGSLGASASTDFLTLSADVMTPGLPLAFELMADAVMRPAFAASEVELLRTQTLSALQVAQSQPTSLASEAMARALYGAHPYSRSASPGSVRAITRADIVAFHKAQLRPSGALMVLAGDVSLNEARRLAMRHFRGWLGTAPVVARSAAPPARTATEITLVHRPGSVQSNILVGNLAAPPDDPRQYAAIVANKVLGGGTDSRLFLILREQKGWTYGAYSNFSRRRALGFFSASAEVRTEVTDSALSELLVQIRRIGSEPLSAADLDAAKGALVGSYPLSVETAGQVAGAVANARLYGLGNDYVQTYRVRLSEVTAEAAEQAARELMRADAAAIVVVGDGLKIYDQLARIAPVRIVDAEGKPIAPAELAAKPPRIPVDLTALRATQDSFVVMLQGNPFGSLASSLEPRADGFTYHERTNLGGFVQQQTEVLLDASLAPRSVKQSGTIQGMQTTIDVVFSGGRASGSATTPDPKAPGQMRTVTIDTPYDAAYLEENLLQPILPGLAWAEGAKWTTGVFSSASGETRTATLAVVGRERVTVPAGTVEAWKVEVTGGPQVTVFWVSVAAPHRLMKIGLVGTPIEMVRVK